MKKISFKEYLPKLKRLKKYSAYMYLAAAVVVVAVTVISISSIGSSDTDVSLPDISVPSIQLPDVSDRPVINAPDDIPAAVEPAQKYYRPVDGEIVTPHSVTELVFSPTMQDYRTHSGIDIAAEVGTEVKCYADGRVVSVYKDTFYGTVVEVLHTDGTSTVYANLDETVPAQIKSGTNVKAGDVLGKIGKTAIIETATQPHLHFEVKTSTGNANPEEYLVKAE